VTVVVRMVRVVMATVAVGDLEGIEDASPYRVGEQ
jgi:hypothetical protein